MPNLDVTFREQSQRWLEDLATRKRSPVSPATLRAFGSYVRKLLPLVGPDTKLENINNGTAKQVVANLCDQGLATKTVNELLATLKAVVASAVDSETGEQLFPRSWSAKHIDCPTIGKQRQPCLTLKQLEGGVGDAASDQERVLYSLLAGSGLRISECLAVRVRGTDEQTAWNPETATISVRATMFNGRELQRVKTPAAIREVDLDPRLNALLDQFVTAHNILSGQFLFQAKTGRALHLKTARERLAKHGIPGFHSFRRYRITHLRELGVPEDILRYWVGHEGHGMTDRYSKLGENVTLRREWAHRTGLLGFDLPDLSKQGPPAPCTASPGRTAKPVTPHAPAKSTESNHHDRTVEPAEFVEPSYVGVDSDLPDLFFEECTFGD